jgi:hypothetical protein
LFVYNSSCSYKLERIYGTQFLFYFFYRWVVPSGQDVDDLL